MRHSRGIIGGLAVLLFSAGCAAISVGANHDPGLSTAAFRTFAFEGHDAYPTGDARLDAKPFFDARVRAAVGFELAAKGLLRASDNPDLLIHYHATAERRLEVIRSDEGKGYADATGGNTVSREYEEGTLVVDVVDRKTRQVIWRGWVRQDLADMLNNPRAMDAYCQKAVRAMFQRFPERGTDGQMPDITSRNLPDISTGSARAY